MPCGAGHHSSAARGQSRCGTEVAAWQALRLKNNGRTEQRTSQQDMPYRARRERIVKTELALRV